MTNTPPTNPSLRRGIHTSEFLLAAITSLVGWIPTLLVLLGDLKSVVPERYNVYVILASSLLTAIASHGYSTSRGQAKAAAAAAVPGYLAVTQQLAPPITEITRSAPIEQTPNDEEGIDPNVDPSTLQ
jgi:hypothetical protein